MDELERIAEKVEKGKHIEVPEDVKKALDGKSHNIVDTF